jgi:hypothetical protein
MIADSDDAGHAGNPLPTSQLSPVTTRHAHHEVKGPLPPSDAFDSGVKGPLPSSTGGKGPFTHYPAGGASRGHRSRGPVARRRARAGAWRSCECWWSSSRRIVSVEGQRGSGRPGQLG